jgi:hypothetical protein
LKPKDADPKSNKNAGRKNVANRKKLSTAALPDPLVAAALPEGIIKAMRKQEQEIREALLVMPTGEQTKEWEATARSILTDVLSDREDYHDRNTVYRKKDALLSILP